MFVSVVTTRMRMALMMLVVTSLTMAMTKIITVSPVMLKTIARTMAKISLGKGRQLSRIMYSGWSQ
jgi:hypothetical protein